MPRIATTISGFERTLLNLLAESTAASNLSSVRLASGQIITAPKDDPSGFVTLSRYQSEKSLLTRSLANVTAASSLVSQAQLALDQVRTQLNTIRAKAIADEDQALTAEQRLANQAAIDAAVAQVDRLAGSAIGSRRVLDGSANYTFAGQNVSQVSNVQVLTRGDGSVSTISGLVTSAATRAQLTYTGLLGSTTSAATFMLTGDRGAVSISVANGEALTAVRDRINLEAHRTGVTASVTASILTLSSIEYGTSADVQVAVTSGTFNVLGGNGDGTANGTNAAATINGKLLTGDGNRFALSDPGLTALLDFAPGFVGAFSSITVTGEALPFSLTTDPGDLATLAIPGVQAARLGGLSGTLNQLVTGGAAGGLGTNAPLAVRIVDEALDDLTRIEGIVDAFAETAIASSASLAETLGEKLGEAIDAIDQVDEAKEEALRAKTQSLAGNALAALSILDQQRASVVAILQKIAGLD